MTRKLVVLILVLFVYAGLSAQTISLLAPICNRGVARNSKNEWNTLLFQSKAHSYKLAPAWVVDFKLEVVLYPGIRLQKIRIVT